jgi:outer membrane protein assembly factor BamB
VLFFLSSTLWAQVAITGRGYDNRRTGTNPNETILTPANVASNFGKLYTINLDSQVYAQPLYVSGLTINGAVHNVVFVETMDNSLYAFDGDNAQQLWHVNYGTPMVTSEIQYSGNPNIDPKVPTGILSTPVIDVPANTMYFVHAQETKSGSTSTYSYTLEGIDIRTGAKNMLQTTITGTYQTADMSTPLSFIPKHENQRASLALANGNVYVAFASHGDSGPYQGWVFAYQENTLKQVGIYVDTTIGNQGGIWQAGSAPAVDDNGNIYYSTGNGSFGPTPAGLVQTANSFIKLSPTLQLLDYFTPYNSATMNASDQDLGSSGILLIPDPRSNSTATKYVIGGGKQGVLYMTDVNNMGEFNTSQDAVVQEFQAVYGSGTSHIHGTPVYINDPTRGPSIYVWGENDVVRMFTLNTSTGLINTTPYATGTVTAPATYANGAMPGGFISMSANGTSNQILWASTPYNANAVKATVQGVLYAFDGATLNLLWSDKMNDSRDEVGNFAKFVPPVVANGKVYVVNFGKVGTTKGTGQLLIYGLLH